MDVDRFHDGTEEDAGDKDELMILYSDLNDSRHVLDTQPLRLDHCDLLLDAMDAELSQLQIPTQNHLEHSKKPESYKAAPLQWSQSLCKDTGLRSTSLSDTPMSCLELIQTPAAVPTSDRGGKNAMSCEVKKKSDGNTRNLNDIETHREEVLWRLERLLGDTCIDDVIAKPQPLSDSICTEDFVRHFRDEMVEVALPESNIPQLDGNKVMKRAENSDSDTCLNKQKGQGVRQVRRMGSSLKSTREAVVTQTNETSRRMNLRKCLSHSVGVNKSYVNEEEAQRINEDGRMKQNEKMDHDKSCSHKTRFLTGVPVMSFDSVSIASDLDSVSTDQVRQNIQSCPGWRFFIQSVTGLEENLSDFETVTEEKSEAQSSSVHSSSFTDKRSPSVCKVLQKKSETFRTLINNDKGTDEEINHCSGQHRSERIQCGKMKEQLKNLRQKCEKEEELLLLKRSQLKDIDLCISELRQRRKHALQELERLTAETAQLETEKQSVESVLSDMRMEQHSVSCQVGELQRQRQSCLNETRDLEIKLASLSQRKETLKAHSDKKKNSMWMLEREEMEQLLDSTKTALFAEQRPARKKLESLHENLEQTCEELVRATEAERSMRCHYARLQEKHIRKKEYVEVLEVQVRDLQVELREGNVRVGTLEKMLAQKELQLFNIQEERQALQIERSGLKGELQLLRKQQNSALKETEAHNYKTMLQEEESNKLKISLEQQKKNAKKCEEELRTEASAKEHKALEEERRKWEREKKAVQLHCKILEEQNGKSLESMKNQMQQEKTKAQALQRKVLELKTKIQELEQDGCTQQREQESLLSVICKSLKEEHQAELQKLRKEIGQETHRTVVQLEQAAHLAEDEANMLRVMLKDKESTCNQIRADWDQQHRHWAQKLGAECQHLHLLLEQSRAKQSSVQLPVSSSVAEGLTRLRAVREEVEQLISHLQQELDLQKQATEQLRNDKDQEMSIQRQQLRKDKNQALEFLKERLIQEHIDELSSMKRAHLNDRGEEGGEGMAASLRKQLEAKDLELKQVQRCMGQWKEQTAAHLACTFEEELTAELESKTQSGKERRRENPEDLRGEMTPCAKTSAASSSPSVVLSAAFHRPSDVASFKLLRYLQTKVKQLRLENQAYTWSSSPPLSLS
ncbi:trichohyalin-like isoform X2 [Cynoglossus semilaevis]|uniref:trichohyalin-like isoform X2 n=1 Tax=Cynoglossus semilaevis TaxID=244447 RepID=UPI0007DC8C5A|nr:trichohyalin-like isoform X2 [Cynoglossus semilaevis]